MDQPIPTIHEDNRIIVVHKPSGVFVHRSETWDRSEVPLLQRVRDQVGRHVYVVHRLDRGTSGLVVLAKDRDTASQLSLQFRERRVCKTYQALVRGFCPQQDIITFALARKGEANDRPDAEPSAAERPCCTEYRSISQFEIPLPSGRYESTRCSLLQVQPKTGRWHQIRRHMNRVSHPVIGDSTHGDNTQNRFFRDTFSMQRLMLAATELQFQHPETAEALALSCAPDQSFQGVIDQIQQWQVAFPQPPELGQSCL